MSIENPVTPENIDELRRSDDLFHVYANGFTIAHSNSDTSLILQRSGKPVAIIDLTYGVAKTLVQKLGRLIVEIEEKTKVPVLTTDEMATRLQKAETQSEETS